MFLASLQLFILSVELQQRLEDCRGFLQCHASTLSAWPALFIQQALNDPPETPAHVWAEGLLGQIGGGGVRVIECLNRDVKTSQEVRLDLFHLVLF